MKDVFSQSGEKKFALPSFSYNDYLRLMLLIGVDDEVKLYRVMDLIQFNLQENRSDNTLVLADYATGYEVTAQVSVNYLFFLGYPSCQKKQGIELKIDINLPLVPP